MNREELNLLRTDLIGKSIPKPLSGTLSEHAAGEPFEKYVLEILKKHRSNGVFKQYEYINDLFLKNPKAISHGERMALFQSPTLMLLLSRGKSATERWSSDNPFEEKQNDTADILLIHDGIHELIDVKTRNISKNAQQPNIISAYKLAQVCAKMLDNEEFNTFEINYLEIDWRLEVDKLMCSSIHYAELFRTNPSDLYINWAAAMQIQFHVCDLGQDFSGTRKEWALQYLRHFVSQARKRANDMLKKFVEPFEKYLHFPS